MKIFDPYIRDVGILVNNITVDNNLSINNRSIDILIQIPYNDCRVSFIGCELNRGVSKFNPKLLRYDEVKFLMTHIGKPIATTLPNSKQLVLPEGILTIAYIYDALMPKPIELFVYSIENDDHDISRIVMDLGMSTKLNFIDKGLNLINNGLCKCLADSKEDSGIAALLETLYNDMFCTYKPIRNITATTHKDKDSNIHFSIRSAHLLKDSNINTTKYTIIDPFYNINCTINLEENKMQEPVIKKELTMDKESFKPVKNFTFSDLFSQVIETEEFKAAFLKWFESGYALELTPTIQSIGMTDNDLTTISFSTKDDDSYGF